MAQPGLAEDAPIPAGYAQYQKLVDGGVPQDQIAAWQQGIDQKLVAGGVPQAQIDAYWGNAKPSAPKLTNYVQNNLAATPASAPPNTSEDLMHQFSTGFDMSVPGLALHAGAEPHALATPTFMDKLAQTGGQMLGDFPIGVLGAAEGAAKTAEFGPEAQVAAAGAGYLMAPQAMREALIDGHKAGTIHTAWDALNLGAQSVLHVVEQGAEGAGAALAGHGAEQVASTVLGAAAGRVANVLAQTTAFTGWTAAMERHMPDAQDFAAGAVMALGLHVAIEAPEAVKRVASNMQRIYARTGVPPHTAIDLAKNDSVIHQELLQQDVNGNPVHPVLTALAPPEPEPYNKVTPKVLRLPAPAEAEVAPKAEKPAPAEEPRFIHPYQDLLETQRLPDSEVEDGTTASGGVGRYQIPSGTARYFGYDPIDLKDPVLNERAAATIMMKLGQKYHGNEADMLLAYHSGVDAVGKWILEGRKLTDLTNDQQQVLINGGAADARNRVVVPAGMRELIGAGGGGGGAEPPNTRAGGAALPPPGGPKTTDDSYDKMEEQIGTVPKKTIRQHLEDAWTGWVSWLAPAVRIDNMLIKQGALNRADEVTLEDMGRQTISSISRRDYFLKEGTLLPEFDKARRLVGYVHASDHSMKRAFQYMDEDGGNVDHFMKFMLAGRNILKAQQGKVLGFDLADSHQIRNDKAEQAKYWRAEREWNDVMDGILAYGKAGGLFSRQQVESMIKENLIYVTARRLLGYEGPPGRGRGIKVGKAVRAFKGGTEQILDPVQSSFDNMLHIIHEADKNMFTGYVISRVQESKVVRDDLGLQKEEMPKLSVDKATLKEAGVADPSVLDPFMAMRVSRTQFSPNQFMYLREGVPEMWSTRSPSFAALLKGADSPGQVNLLVKLAEKVAAIQRTGITALPEFTLRTLMRHSLNSYIFDPTSPPPFVTWWSGLMDVLGHADVVKQWKANGGASSALYDMDRDSLHEDLPELLNKTGALKRMYNLAWHPLELARLIQQVSNEASGVGYFKRGLKLGLPPAKAAMGSKTQKIDFNEGGTDALVRTWSKVTPFTREHLLGTKQVKEGYERDPIGTTMKLLYTIVLPAAVLRYLNYRQDQDGTVPLDQQYQSLSRYEKDGFYVLPQIKGFRLKIPLPFVVGTPLASLTNRMFDHFIDHDPRAFKDWGQTLMAELFPPVFGSLILPPLEQLTNHNFFTGRPLIPDSLAKVSGPLQYTAATSETAKFLSYLASPLVDVSPITIDTYVNGWFGSLGQAGMWLSGLAFHHSDLGELAKNPFVKTFLVMHPGMSSSSIQDFYDEKEKFDRSVADVRLTIARQREGMTGLNDKEMDQAIRDRLPGAQNIDQMAAMMRKAESTIRRTTNLPDAKDDPENGMTLDEKRQIVSGIYSNMIEISKNGVKRMDEIEQQAKAIK